MDAKEGAYLRSQWVKRSKFVFGLFLVYFQCTVCRQILAVDSEVTIKAGAILLNLTSCRLAVGSADQTLPPQVGLSILAEQAQTRNDPNLQPWLDQKRQDAANTSVLMIQDLTPFIHVPFQTRCWGEAYPTEARTWFCCS